MSGRYNPSPRAAPRLWRSTQVLTLTRYTDGTPLATVPIEARTTLSVHGFHYHQGTFLLPASCGRAGQALRIQAVAQQLAAHGVV